MEGVISKIKRKYNLNIHQVRVYFSKLVKVTVDLAHITF